MWPVNPLSRELGKNGVRFAGSRRVILSDKMHDFLAKPY
jgi:hypothetical protein